MTVSSRLAMRLVIASGAFLMTELVSPAAANAEPPQSPQTTQIAASPTVGRHTDMIILTVDKKALQAELKTWPEDPKGSSLLKRFRIAIGKAEGDKQQEGDNRTPEGIYFAQSHIRDENLPTKYGRKAIPIDFPNPIDRASGKTGHGIWLHGVEHDGRVDEAKVTEGCVAFYNADISSLANWLKGYQGVVVIAKDLNDVNKPDDLQTVENLTRGWMQAWADRKVDDYVKFYRTDFRFGKMDLAGYADFKRRVFSSYKNMKVTFDNLRVVTHPKYAVAFFNQDFHGDQRFTSIGRKALYWERNDNGSWAIRREVFENRRFEFMTFTDAELAMLSAATPAGVSQEKKSPSL